ncbi:MAG TPA: MAPEG family protein [Caulobacteraceae bacterium]|nr:MAPEG family protein [Caulobacteraceae bacterium]
MSGPSTELAVLGWSMALFVVHMMVQAAPALRDRGVAFNAGPRDDPKPLGSLGGRAQRAFDNYRETYPIFVALALGLMITGHGGGLAATGAWLWLAARLVYLPLYVFGVPWLRTLSWGVAAIGLILMASRLFA